MWSKSNTVSSGLVSGFVKTDLEIFVFVFEISLNPYIQFGWDIFFPVQFDIIFHLIKVSDLDYDLVLRKAQLKVPKIG